MSMLMLTTLILVVLERQIWARGMTVIMAAMFPGETRSYHRYALGCAA